MENMSEIKEKKKYRNELNAYVYINTLLSLKCRRKHFQWLIFWPNVNGNHHKSGQCHDTIE